MLKTGRWYVFILMSLILALAPHGAHGADKGSTNQKTDPRTIAAITAEQAKAFELSAAPRTMPASAWFVESVYEPINSDSGEFSESGRWLSKVDTSHLAERAAERLLATQK